MTLHRRDITWQNVNTLIREIKIGPGQEGLVAPNEVTIAQAAYYPGSTAWALYDDDTVVGLIAMTKIAEDPALEPGDDPDGAYLWRLLIGHQFQGKGYGKAALTEAVSQSKEWNCPRLYVSVDAGPTSNIGFYEAAGFVKTGRIVDDEIELRLDL